MNVTSRRLAETAGMLMIGDGALGLVRPSYHCLLWRGGAAWWRGTVEWFADHPQFTRACAAAELAAGLWLGMRQETAAVEERVTHGRSSARAQLSGRSPARARPGSESVQASPGARS